MKIFYTIKPLIILTFATLLFSCGQSEEKDMDTTKEGNVSTTISIEINKLEKLIDLKKYKPIQVKYKYVFIYNSAEEQRLSVPGPSDSNLEAILYFDNKTFKKLAADNLKLSTISTNRKDAYRFDWLDTDVKMELSKTDSSYTDFPPTFFTTASLRNGGYFMLDNKILIRLYTN